MGAMMLRGWRCAMTLRVVCLRRVRCRRAMAHGGVFGRAAVRNARLAWRLMAGMARPVVMRVRMLRGWRCATALRAVCPGRVGCRRAMAHGDVLGRAAWRCVRRYGCWCCVAMALGVDMPLCLRRRGSRAVAWRPADSSCIRRHRAVAHRGVLRAADRSVAGGRRRGDRLRGLRGVVSWWLGKRMAAEAAGQQQSGGAKRSAVHAPSSTRTSRIIPASMWYSRWQW